MSDHETAGRLGPEFLAPGTSSFLDFLTTHHPQLLPTSSMAAPDSLTAHGTTVLALRYRDGVLMAGDRRATMGSLIAQHDLDKVYPADEYSAVAFAGSVGIALDLVKLYQVELAHFDKLEGAPMSTEAKAVRLSALIRNNLAQAAQGLTVIPLLACFDHDAPAGGQGRIFSYDVVGGIAERSDFHVEGSGSPHGRGSLKKLYRAGQTRERAALVALHALYDAADEDSATGGPDIGRRIFPILATVTSAGYERIDETTAEQLTRAMLDQRRLRPDGPPTREIGT